ncbi:uncharacterized protein [Henckelia pumila]|uniref:uncharacterized protein n=1 Tax=Henckelia pumila TaxID=405737 RepID=UPI003C6E2508
MGNEVEEDSKRESAKWYRKLCMIPIRLATEASVHPSTFTLVHNLVCDLTKQVMEILLNEVSQEDNVGVRTSSIGPSMIQVKGFKKKIGLKKSIRLKSWVELQAKRRKTNSRVEAQFDHPQDSPEAMDFNGDISKSCE